MATSENQGLQIALIIFIILVVVLALTTVLFFRSYEEAQAKADQRSKEAKRANDAARNTQDEINEMKQMIGFEPTANIEEIRQTYQEDMEKFAGTFPAEKQKYHEVLPLMQNSIAESNRLLALEKEKVASLTEDLAAIQAAAKTQVVQNQQAAEAAQQDRDSERDKLRNTVAMTQKAQQATDQKIDRRLNEIASVEQELRAQSAELEHELNQTKGQLSTTVTAFRDIQPKERFEHADGEIVRVDPAKNTVWIDLGRADGLQRQTTFSVHDANNNRIDQAKAHIEVTRVLLDHLAEARISKDDVANPIVRGDQIYSPAWKPGRQVHFALAGWMDIDGDGNSDRRMVKHLIDVADGVVDAEVTDEGHRTGKLSIHTRYLVLGEQPSVAVRDAEAGRGGDIVQAYSDIISEAEKYKVEQISLNRFLDLVGYEPRTTVLNEESDRTQFRDPEPDGGRRPSLGRLNEAFKERRPPSATNGASRSGSGY